MQPNFFKRKLIAKIGNGPQNKQYYLIIYLYLFFKFNHLSSKKIILINLLFFFKWIQINLSIHLKLTFLKIIIKYKLFFFLFLHLPPFSPFASFRQIIQTGLALEIIF